jgi:hypothetical protein
MRREPLDQRAVAEIGRLQIRRKEAARLERYPSQRDDSGKRNRDIMHWFGAITKTGDQPLRDR